MAVKLPVTAYLGVAIRMEPPADDDERLGAVVLEHRDPGLSLPLYRADDGDDIIAEWQSWARVLGLPLLVAEADGRLREPFARIGARARRHRPPAAAPALAIRARRPSILLRRQGRAARSPTRAVHRDEREIIARN